jgi:hypothetical protein
MQVTAAGRKGLRDTFLDLSLAVAALEILEAPALCGRCGGFGTSAVNGRRVDGVGKFVKSLNVLSWEACGSIHQCRLGTGRGG